MLGGVCVCANVRHVGTNVVEDWDHSFRVYRVDFLGHSVRRSSNIARRHHTEWVCPFCALCVLSNHGHVCAFKILEVYDWIVATKTLDRTHVPARRAHPAMISW